MSIQEKPGECTNNESNIPAQMPCNFSSEVGAKPTLAWKEWCESTSEVATLKKRIASMKRELEEPTDVLNKTWAHVQELENMMRVVLIDTGGVFNSCSKIAKELDTFFNSPRYEALKETGRLDADLERLNSDGKTLEDMKNRLQAIVKGMKACLYSEMIAAESKKQTKGLAKQNKALSAANAALCRQNRILSRCSKLLLAAVVLFEAYQATH